MSVVQEIRELQHRTGLSTEQLHEIRALYATGAYPARSLGSRFGLTQAGVLEVVMGPSLWHQYTG